MKSTEQFEAFNPWAEVEPFTVSSLSIPLAELKGKTIGLFSSSKQASDNILIAVEENLRVKLPETKLVWYRAGNYFHGQPYYRKPEEQEWKRLFEEWLKGVDGVILAQGD